MINKPKPKILVVEDEVNSLRLLEKILSPLDCQVICAKDGVEALEILTQDPEYDLVLSDWVMPNLDGIELCKKIKEKESLRQIFFIILSSRDESQDKVSALDSGADEYLTKPCNPDELMARVRAGMRIRELQREVSDLERNMGILQLAATAGHEINNPLTGIFGYIDLLREAIQSGQPSEDLVGYVERMADQSRRIRDVVSRLISLSEVQTKRYLGGQEMIDLGTETFAAEKTEET